MSILKIPHVPRPQPLRPSLRQKSFAGEASLATAKAQTIDSALRFGTALAKLAAGKGQAEYNNSLVKYKKAEMEKIAEIEAAPIDYLEDKETGTSKDDLSKLNAMRALPNTTALRQWRKEYLDNELFPEMKSDKAKDALRLKIDADSLNVDKSLIKMDYQKNKARLADSYSEKANVFIQAGERNEYRATILEANKIGVYDAQTADDLLDTGFALMHQNDLIKVAMAKSFEENGYGNEQAGKDIIGKNLSYKSYTGDQKLLNQAEVNKLFDQTFKDQRKAYTNQVNEYYAKAEDNMAEMYNAGTLTNDIVLKTYQDIPETTGKERQRYWLGKSKELEKGEKSGTGLTDENKNSLYEILNSTRTKEAKKTAIIDFKHKNNLDPNDVNFYLTAAEKYETNPAIQKFQNMVSPREKEIKDLREKGNEEKSREYEKAVMDIKDSILKSLLQLDSIGDFIKREDREKQILENASKMLFDLDLAKATTDTDLNTNTTAGGSKVFPKQWREIKEKDFSGVTGVEGVQADIAKMQRFEQDSISEQMNIDTKNIISTTSQTNGESVNHIIGADVEKFAPEYRGYDKTLGNQKVMIKMEPGKNKVILKIYNARRKTWDLYREIEGTEYMSEGEEKATEFVDEYLGM